MRFFRGFASQTRGKLAAVRAVFAQALFEGRRANPNANCRLEGTKTLRDQVQRLLGVSYYYSISFSLSSSMSFPFMFIVLHNISFSSLCKKWHFFIDEGIDFCWDLASFLFFGCGKSLIYLHTTHSHSISLTTKYSIFSCLFMTNHSLAFTHKGLHLKFQFRIFRWAVPFVLSIEFVPILIAFENHNEDIALFRHDHYFQELSRMNYDGYPD